MLRRLTLRLNGRRRRRRKLVFSPSSSSSFSYANCWPNRQAKGERERGRNKLIDTHAASVIHLEFSLSCSRAKIDIKKKKKKKDKTAREIVKITSWSFAYNRHLQSVVVTSKECLQYNPADAVHFGVCSCCCWVIWDFFRGCYGLCL